MLRVRCVVGVKRIHVVVDGKPGPSGSIYVGAEPFIETYTYCVWNTDGFCKHQAATTVQIVNALIDEILGSIRELKEHPECTQGTRRKDNNDWFIEEYGYYKVPTEPPMAYYSCPGRRPPFLKYEYIKGSGVCRLLLDKEKLLEEYEKAGEFNEEQKRKTFYIPNIYSGEIVRLSIVEYIRWQILKEFKKIIVVPRLKIEFFPNYFEQTVKITTGGVTVVDNLGNYTIITTKSARSASRELVKVIKI